MRKLAAWLAVGFAVAWGFVRVTSVYGHKFYDLTGQAQWIWAPIDITRDEPVAFFAIRDFDLPANRYYTKVKIIGDPEYTFYFNGHEIAGRRNAENVLDVYDLSAFAVTGRNRIVVAMRATRGVGGLLVAVDISPETKGFLVTDGSWRISEVWDPALPTRDAGPMARPLTLGQPPVGRWNYLEPRAAQVAGRPGSPIAPRATFPYTATMAVVKVIDGTAIRTRMEVPAVAYDFSDIDGRLRLTRRHGTRNAELVTVRFANTREELLSIEGSVRTYAFARGEQTIVDPEVRRFRYVGVQQNAAAVEALVNR